MLLFYEIVEVMRSPRTYITLIGFLILLVALLWKLAPTSNTNRESISTDLPPLNVESLAKADDFSKAWKRASLTSTDREEIITKAKAHKDAFILLMREDPAKALKEAISISEYAALPDELKPYFERPYSVRGDVDLLWETSLHECAHGEGCSESHRSCFHRNTVSVNGIKYEAFSETKRHLPVLQNIPLAGIQLDHQVVITESPILHVNQTDFEAAASLFPEGVRYDSENSSNAVIIAGMLHTMDTAQEIAAVEKVLTQVASEAVAERTSYVENPFEWLAGNTGGDDGEPPQATPYQEDQIDVLFIRVDFSDFPGEPITQTALETTLSTVNSHLNNFSYGEAGITYTVTNQTYRMPSSGANYATDSSAGDGIDGNDRIQTDARALASADYTIANYDVIAVYFPNLGGVSGSLITYGGRGSIGGSKHWINGFNSVGIILHEFGHNYGLYHANYYHPEQSLSGTYDISTSLEYGDIFDEMGSGNSPEAHFSHLAKNYMQWMPDSKVTEVTGDGTYTVYRFDDINAISNPTLALKVPMSGDVNYWVGYRQLYTSSTYNLSNAAYVVAENLASARETSLIDMTPESQTSETNDRRDAGLPVGSTFYDSNAGVEFESIATGGTSPNEWIQVKITFDSRISVAETELDVDEQSGVAHVTVRRQFGSSGFVSVNYATSNNDATAGDDYYAVSGTLTWEDGETDDKTIIVPIRPDIIADGGESFTLTLSGVIGGTLDPNAASTEITLLDAGQRITTFAPGFFNNSVYAITPLEDGKVLIGGNISHTRGDFSNTNNLARLNSNGSIDNSFITGTGFNGLVRDIAVQDDDKVIVVGDFTTYNGSSCNRIVRLNSNGSIDSSFLTAIGSAADDDIWSVAIESSGDILLGGVFDNFKGIAANGLVRLQSSGLPTTLNLPFGSNATVWCVLAEPDGTIMVGGNFTISTGFTTIRDIARLTNTGSRDTSFNPGSGSNGGVYHLSKTPDDKYILGGYFNSYNGSSAERCCRINSSGSLDTTFIPPSINSSIRVVTTQPDGKSLIGGFFTSPASRLERLTSSGPSDSSFDQGSGPNGSVYSVALDNKGSIWVGGNFFSYNGSTSRPIVKITGGISAYDIWVQTQFTASEIAAGDADPDADPDGDDMSNLAEMAMGTNPTVANTDPVFAVSSDGGVTIQEDNGQQYLQIKLDKTALSEGAWFVAEFSSDLETWSPADPTPAVNSTYDVLENSATHFIVRDKTPISTSSPRFGRIVIKLPE